jgi:hypothetical protein
MELYIRIKKEEFMKKAVKIGLITIIAVVVVAGVLFVVIPLATSNMAEARLGEALGEAGVPEDMWSVGKVRYIPIFGRLIIDEFEMGNGSLEVDKITLSLSSSRNDLFAGSVYAKGVSLAMDGTEITAKSFSVGNFAIDKTLFDSSPMEALKKLGTVRVSETEFKQNGKLYFSIGRLNADIRHTGGKIILPASLLLKDITVDVRQFIPIRALSPEYQISTLELKNGHSGNVYTTHLTIDAPKFFKMETDVGLSYPGGLIEAMGIVGFTRIDDAMLSSLAFTYTDKSVLDHVLNIAGVPGGRAGASDLLDESIMFLDMMGEADTERLASEVKKFLAKPGTFELKTNIKSPVSLEDIGDNPFALNPSLSINGGKPFTISN